MPILNYKKPPDFSARILLNFAEQVMAEDKKSYYYMIGKPQYDVSDIPLLIMKAILRWEEIKAEDPNYGVIKRDESQEPDVSPETDKQNQ